MTMRSEPSGCRSVDVTPTPRRYMSNATRSSRDLASFGVLECRGAKGRRLTVPRGEQRRVYFDAAG